jgi:hypothetical protein
MVDPMVVKVWRTGNRADVRAEAAITGRRFSSTAWTAEVETPGGLWLYPSLNMIREDGSLVSAGLATLAETGTPSSQGEASEAPASRHFLE